jgi:hypothetical protein
VRGLKAPFVANVVVGFDAANSENFFFMKQASDLAFADTALSGRRLSRKERMPFDFLEHSVRTISDYCRVFRRLVADIARIKRDEKKYDYVNGGRNEWLSKVDPIKPTEITREKVEAWRAGYLAQVGEDMERLCKSLFSPSRLELLGPAIPSLSP